MQSKEEKIGWYAVKVFYNRLSPILDILEDSSIRSFVPEGLIPSLLFMQTTELYVRSFQEQNYSRAWVYSDPITHRPSVIPTKEMDIFIFVVTAGAQGLLYLGEDKPEYHIGDRVRVTDGPFKGAEGHIKRIKKDRRLIITVAGVAAVATSFIHPDFLEKV